MAKKKGDNIEEDQNKRVSKKELRNTYHKYCRKHKLRGSSDKSIKITLQNMFGVIEGQSYETKERYWDGIKFKGVEVEVEKI